MEITEMLSRYMIATEVDDVGMMAQQQAQGMSGKSGSRKPGSATGVTGKEDIGDIDIIHSGTSDQDDDGDGTPDAEDPDSTDPIGEDIPEDEDSTDEDDADGEEDPTTDEDPTNLDNDSHGQDPAFDKNKIKDNLILFHGIITSNINLLRDCMRQITDPEMVSLYNSVIDNFQNCKTMCYDMLTQTDFTQVPYTDLLRKYVALNRVHELGIKMIKMHADERTKKNLKSGKGSKNKK